MALRFRRSSFPILFSSFLNVHLDRGTLYFTFSLSWIRTKISIFHGFCKYLHHTAPNLDQSVVWAWYSVNGVLSIWYDWAALISQNDHLLVWCNDKIGSIGLRTLKLPFRTLRTVKYSNASEKILSRTFRFFVMTSHHVYKLTLLRRSAVQTGFFPATFKGERLPNFQKILRRKALEKRVQAMNLWRTQ